MANVPHFESSPYKMTEVTFEDDQGNWLSTEPFNQELVLGGFAIGYFSRDGDKSGTGFIIQVFEDKESLKSGIILTAAHVFYCNFKYIEEPIEFILGSESFEARPITRTFDWNDKQAFMIDPISKQQITIPNDWIFCELWRKTKPAMNSEVIIALKLNKEINLYSGLEVFVVGYPKPITKESVEYAAPGSQPSELHSIQRSIHYGQELVVSNGKILKIGQMIALSCVSTNGCSGSPVLIISNGEYKFIGLLHGGPASFLHKQVAGLLHDTQSPRLQEIIQVFYKKVKKFKRNIQAKGYGPDLMINGLMYYLKKFSEKLRKGINFPESHFHDIFNVYYDKALKIEVRNGFKANYNLCYPIHELNLN